MAYAPEPENENERENENEKFTQTERDSENRQKHCLYVTRVGKHTLSDGTDCGIGSPDQSAADIVRLMKFSKLARRVGGKHYQIGSKLKTGKDIKMILQGTPIFSVVANEKNCRHHHHRAPGRPLRAAGGAAGDNIFWIPVHGS